MKKGISKYPLIGSQSIKVLKLPKTKRFYKALKGSDGQGVVTHARPLKIIFKWVA